MKKILLPMTMLAMIMLPAAANAAQCRNMDTGKFAKCGSPGSIAASQYVAKTKMAAKKPMAPMVMPAAAPAKPGLMAMLKAKAAAKAQAKAGMPAAKVVRCKNAKSKFVKCGTPGAKPV
ncbi:MAG: hypothetical protein M3N34_10100 [Pseudomonadota bacterium]|nr:hypothetical protein [Pseudomonadota bacterium]